MVCLFFTFVLTTFFPFSGSQCNLVFFLLVIIPAGETTVCLHVPSSSGGSPPRQLSPTCRTWLIPRLPCPRFLRSTHFSPSSVGTHFFRAVFHQILFFKLLLQPEQAFTRVCSNVFSHQILGPDLRLSVYFFVTPSAQYPSLRHYLIPPFTEPLATASPETGILKFTPGQALRRPLAPSFKQFPLRSADQLGPLPPTPPVFSFLRSFQYPNKLRQTLHLSNYSGGGAVVRYFSPHSSHFFTPFGVDIRHVKDFRHISHVRDRCSSSLAFLPK